MKRQIRSQPVSRERGFALLESVIAFVILAVGILSLLAFHSSSQTNIAESKAQAEAMAIAEDRLKRLESFLSESSAVDDRLNVATETEAVPGQLATYTVVSDVSDASGTLKVATITVSWEDRNEDAQQIILKSEIDHRSPSQGAENFLAVLAAADEVRHMAEGGGGSPWTAPGVETVPGEREIVERIANDLYEGEIPDGYEFDNVYIFRIYLSGTISRDGGAAADEVGVIDAEALTVSSIDGVSNTEYVPSCTSGNTSYECVLYYISTFNGWSGTIAFTLNEGDVFCNTADFTSITQTTGTNEPIYTGNKTYEGLEESARFDITIAASANGC